MNSLILLSRNFESFCDSYHVGEITLVVWAVVTLVSLFFLRKNIF